MISKVDDQLSHKKYRKNIDNYKIKLHIATGGFGEIYKILDINSNEVLVAKTIFSTKTTSIQVYREIKILIHLQLPTIIKFLGYSLIDFNNQKNITLFMEYAENKSLYDLLKNERSSSAPFEYDNTSRQIILIGIAHSMMNLNQHLIMHRDLSPANILLDKNWYPKLTDFGLSKKFEKECEFNQSMSCGNPIYMAPENNEKMQYGMKSDVYSFGLIAYEVVSRKSSYNELTKKREPNFVPEFDNSITESIQHLILKCLSINPSDRPTFQELYNLLTDNKYFLYNVDEDRIIEYIEYITDHEVIQDFVINESINEISKNKKAHSKKQNNEAKTHKELTKKSNDKICLNDKNDEKCTKNTAIKNSPRRKTNRKADSDKCQMNYSMQNKVCGKKNSLCQKNSIENDENYLLEKDSLNLSPDEKSSNLIEDSNYNLHQKTEYGMTSKPLKTTNKNYYQSKYLENINEYHNNIYELPNKQSSYLIEDSNYTLHQKTENWMTSKPLKTINNIKSSTMQAELINDKIDSKDKIINCSHKKIKAKNKNSKVDKSSQTQKTLYSPEIKHDKNNELSYDSNYKKTEDIQMVRDSCTKQINTVRNQPSLGRKFNSIDQKEIPDLHEINHKHHSINAHKEDDFDIKTPKKTTKRSSSTYVNNKSSLNLNMNKSKGNCMTRKCSTRQVNSKNNQPIIEKKTNNKTQKKISVLHANNDDKNQSKKNSITDIKNNENNLNSKTAKQHNRSSSVQVEKNNKISLNSNRTKKENPQLASKPSTKPTINRNNKISSIKNQNYNMDSHKNDYKHQNKKSCVYNLYNRKNDCLNIKTTKNSSKNRSSSCMNIHNCYKSTSNLNAKETKNYGYIRKTSEKQKDTNNIYSHPLNNKDEDIQQKGTYNGKNSESIFKPQCLLI